MVMVTIHPGTDCRVERVRGRCCGVGPFLSARFGGVGATRGGYGALHSAADGPGAEAYFTLSTFSPRNDF